MQKTVENCCIKVPKYAFKFSYEKFCLAKIFVWENFVGKNFWMKKFCVKKFGWKNFLNEKILLVPVSERNKKSFNLADKIAYILTNLWVSHIKNQKKRKEKRLQIFNESQFSMKHPILQICRIRKRWRYFKGFMK